MEGYWLWTAALAVAGVALLIYWEIQIVEGVHLGRRVVAWLYNRFADQYDEVKEYDWEDEQQRLAVPLLRLVEGLECPRVLDVATGTGRLPRLLIEAGFAGQIVALDSSSGMLRKAVEHCGAQVTFICKDATQLPFPDDTFDAVTCLEALEFMPDPRQVLREIVRVSRPGGVIVVSNRTGWQAYLFLNRRFSRTGFAVLLQSLGLQPVLTQDWQVDYDLVWARKEGVPDRRNETYATTHELIRCPACGAIAWDFPQWVCCACGYVVRDEEGILYMDAKLKVV